MIIIRLFTKCVLKCHCESIVSAGRPFARRLKYKWQMGDYLCWIVSLNADLLETAVPNTVERCLLIAVRLKKIRNYKLTKD